MQKGTKNPHTYVKYSICFMSNSLDDKFQAHYKVLIIKMYIKYYGVIVPRCSDRPVRACIDMQGAERQHWYRLRSQINLSEASINMIHDNCW